MYSPGDFRIVLWRCIHQAEKLFAWSGVLDRRYLGIELHYIHSHRLASQLQHRDLSRRLFARGGSASYRYAQANGSYPRLQTVARQDILIFVAGFAATGVYFLSGIIKGFLPYFYVFMWSAYTLYLCYFTLQLARAGEALHTLATIVGGLAGLVVALRYDFFPIPETTRRWSS
ncbi:hypothetical protein P4123_10680 [Pseudomonas aeruginosa]|nr:hypothetical protein [Pseudomonas aeruginosa]